MPHPISDPTTYNLILSWSLAQAGFLLPCGLVLLLGGVGIPWSQAGDPTDRDPDPHLLRKTLWLWGALLCLPWLLRTGIYTLAVVPLPPLDADTGQWFAWLQWLQQGSR